MTNLKAKWQIRLKEKKKKSKYTVMMSFYLRIRINMNQYSVLFNVTNELHFRLPSLWEISLGCSPDSALCFLIMFYSDFCSPCCVTICSLNNSRLLCTWSPLPLLQISGWSCSQTWTNLSSLWYLFSHCTSTLSRETTAPTCYLHLKNP